MGNPIDAWAWNYRPLIVIAPAEEDALMAAQRKTLSAQQEALRERDVVIVELVGGRVRIVSGPDVEIDARQLKNRLGTVGDKFEVVLVGKDTGIKLRSDEPVAAADLFGLIDGMPMRQREMKQ